jgi:hypothetical protein
MIKPLNAPQLSAMKPRAGLQRISDLLPRLVEHYEMQAEMVKRRSEAAAKARLEQDLIAAQTTEFPSASQPIVVVETKGAATQQATFGWYE